MRKRNLQPLQERLGYEFVDVGLLRLALTHRSLGKLNNERLEFLGDSILNFCIAERLFEKFPKAKEGELSRQRAALVKGETLAEIALDLELSDYLLLGEGELKSGGFRRASILADAVEAIIGAIMQDSGLPKARECLLSWFSERLKNVSLVDTQKDAKSILQEWLQGKRWALPRYDVVNVEGASHCQNFTVQCAVSSGKVNDKVNDKVNGKKSDKQGEGSTEKVTTAIALNRRQAEKMAAEKMLKLLGLTIKHAANGSVEKR